MLTVQRIKSTECIARKSMLIDLYTTKLTLVHHNPSPQLPHIWPPTSSSCYLWEFVCLL